MMKNETYFEFDEKIKDGFTTVPNYILKDDRLTFKAVGVYAQILQYRKAGNHKIYLNSLSKCRKDKKTAVSTAIQELEKYGYISREYIRNEKGQMNGIRYIVRMKPITNIENTTNLPESEKLNLDKQESDNTILKIKCNKNKISKKENVVDVREKSTQEKVIDLYKTFKIQSRLMPQMVELLHKYSDSISLDVYEHIFIQASEDSVLKKYNYIKTLLQIYFENKVFTKKDLIKYNEIFMISKKNTKKTQVKTRYHGINQSFSKYTEEELEEVCRESQKTKFRTRVQNACNLDNKDYETLYNIALKDGIYSIDADMKKGVTSYAKSNNLYVPLSWTS